jgi:hypothetical protein
LEIPAKGGHSARIPYQSGVRQVSQSIFNSAVQKGISKLPASKSVASLT